MRVLGRPPRDCYHKGYGAAGGDGFGHRDRGSRQERGQSRIWFGLGDTGCVVMLYLLGADYLQGPRSGV